MQYVTVTQAAACKQVSRQTVYNAIEQGILTRFDLSGTVGLLESEVSAWTPLTQGYRRSEGTGGRPKGSKNRKPGDSPYKRPMRAKAISVEVGPVIVEGYLSVNKAAKIKGVTPPSILYAIEVGIFPATRIGSRILIRPADLDAYNPRPKKHQRD